MAGEDPEREGLGQAEPPRPGALPPALFLGAVITMTLLHWFLPGGRPVPPGWRLFGLGIMAPGIWLNWAAHDLFRRHRTTVKPFGEPSALVKRGPFRYTRNPMYLGGVLILLGLAVFLGSWTPVLVVPAFAWIIHSRFIPPEEASLARRFGPDYLGYQERVRRWL